MVPDWGEWIEKKTKKQKRLCKFPLPILCISKYGEGKFVYSTFPKFPKRPNMYPDGWVFLVYGSNESFHLKHLSQL